MFLTRRNLVRLAMLSVAMAPVAASAELPKQFTLGKHVPSECWLYIHAVHNPEREWIDKQWGEVFKAAGELGIDRDIAQLVLSFMEGEQKQQAEALIDKFMKHVKAVRWSDLASQEFVFAQRLAPTQRGNEQLFLARGAPGTAGENFVELKGLLKELASLSDQLVLSETESGDVERASINFKDPKAEEIGIAFELFHSKDVIGLATGKTLADTVVASLDGSAPVASLVKQERFEKALSTVPAPEDEVVYFDLKGFVHELSEMMSGISAKVEEHHKDADGEEAVKGKAILALMREVFSTLDVGDFSIASAKTEGRQQKYVKITRLQEGKDKGMCAEVFLGQKPFEKFDKFIPADAKSFSMNTFVDLEKVYNYVVDFVRKNVPDGAAVIDMFKAKLAEFGVDLQRDFFSWWSGEMISFEVPSAVASPMGGGGDSVHMIRVKDPKLAKEKVFGVLEFVSARAQENGQMLTLPPADIEGGEFRQISHPMLMMFGASFVIGVHDEWLMIGTSGGVKKALAVAKGEQPSIMRNEKFMDEGIVPKGAFLSASFTDKSGFGKEMASVLAGIGMGGQMAIGSIPDKGPEAAKTKQILRSLLGIAMKLGPVLQKIDFLSSESSLTTYDGKLSVREETVMTYKPKEEVAKADAGEKE